MADNPFLSTKDARALPQSSGSGGPILMWVKECIAEGEGFMSADPIWNEVDTNQEYIVGQQKAKAITQDRPSYVSHVVMNETDRTHSRHVSALTDIKPTYAFRTPNPHFQTQSLLLNNLTAVWWINTFADLALADAVSYAAAGGCGDIVVEYDPFYGPMGDIVLYPRDSRDTIPIRPSRDGSIQTWYGCILREAHSYNVMATMYPQYINLLKQSASPWGAGIFTKFKGGLQRILGGGATSTLSGLQKVHTGQQRLSGNEIILYKVQLHDPQINTTDHPIMMGDPGTSYAYTSRPGDRLYPRGRLIICTESGVIWDGPNPYWHGMFNVARLKLKSVPWSFFGLPLVRPQVQSGLQDAGNDVLNAMLDRIRVANRPGMAGNSRVPEPMLRRYDPLNTQARMRTNEQIGTGVDFLKLPDLPNFTFELWQALRVAMHDLTGDSTLDALQAAAANQSFDPESIEAWMNALSPELKLEGRRVELCLREIAEMQKANIFQWYDVKRRVQVLGDAGTTLQDFDYDPGNLIPAMKQVKPDGTPDEAYISELDSNLDQRQRAQFFLKLFTFYVTPNSLLALNAQAEKLKYTMMIRAGICDIWTYWEKMEVPNGGEPPLMMLPSNQPPNDQEMMALQSGVPVPGKSLDPMTGQVMEYRRPMTITERLMAQNQMGLGMNASPVGQKASGQSAPGVDVQDNGDGTKRVKMTESPRDHKPTAGRRAENATH